MSGNAYTIARRLSNDPSQTNDEASHDNHDHIDSIADCRRLATRLRHGEALPDACHEYHDVVEAYQRRQAQLRADAIAYDGFGSDAAAAAASVEHGRLPVAQIERRLTTTKSKRLW